MPAQVEIDGVVYVPINTGPIAIVVIERGFVYVGAVETTPEGAIIRNARSLIRWGSSQHLGELVNGPLENTKLGARCTVRVRQNQIIHVIEVNQDAWQRHING
jgi:hypothetical protein